MNPGVQHIVGGKTAPNHIPWQVYIRIALKTSEEECFGSCGGTIIDEGTILTAAHCVKFWGAKNCSRPENGRSVVDKSKTYIIAGSASKNGGANSQKVIGLSNIITHEQYDRKYNNDIAILKLANRLRFNENVKAACLPPRSDFAPERSGQKAIISGWRTTTTSCEGPSTILQYASLPLITNDACTEMYCEINCDAYPRNRITENMVCAGDGSQDAGRGDSGGPLIVPKSHSDDTAVVFGVVSWAHGCGRTAGVYTRVTKYLDWIQRARQM